MEWNYKSRVRKWRYGGSYLLSSGVKHGRSLYTGVDNSSAEMHFVDDKAHGLLSSFDVKGNLSFVKGYWKGEKVFYLDCSEPGV